MRTCVLSLVTLVLSIAVSGPADTIVFKNGKTREGTVKSQNDQEIVFQEKFGGEITIPRSNLQDIRIVGPGATTPVPVAGVQAAIDDSRMHQQAARFPEAFGCLLNAAQTNPAAAAQLANPFQALVLDLLPKAQAERTQDLERARRMYRALFDALEHPQAQGILASTGIYDRSRQTVRTELSDVLYRIAERSAKQPILLKDSQKYMAEAVAVNPSEPTYRVYLGRIAAANKDYQTAYEQYLAVTQMQGVPDDLKRQANDGISQVRSLAAVRPVASPSVTAVPVFTAAPPSGTATPVPTAVAQAPVAPPSAEDSAPSSEPIMKRVRTFLINNLSVAKLKELGSTVFSGEYTVFVVGIPLFILLFWIAPYYFLRSRANAGDFAAAECRPLAKKIGAAALVLWAMRHARQPQAKNRCPFCNKGIDNIDQYTDLNFYVCPHCRENITPVYDLKDYVQHLIEQLEASGRKAKGTVEGVVEKDAMLKLVRGIMTLAIRRRASDLHIEAELEGAKIRARIDGMMYDMMTLPKSICNAFISAIKIMADLDITERRIPQDGKASLWIDKSDVDLRINTSPASMGEKIAIRILNQKSVTVDPTRLGLEGESLELYERAIHKPHGLVIVTGPSGHGKSTTLYVALNELNTGERNIVTIEDPIEYQLKGLSQMQVNNAANFTFATGLRSILRQDPDVIMVGEVRDKETAEIAVEAAMTGHMVFTTLHTIDAPTAFGRMADLGVDVRRLSSAIICIIAQRLIRTTCPDCKKPYKPKKQDLEVLGIASSAKDHTFVHGAGCENCLNTGYSGRIALFEMLVPDDSMREILETNAAVSVIKELAKKKGYRTLREEGVLKVMQGITTVEEVIRVTT